MKCAILLTFALLVFADETNGWLGRGSRSRSQSRNRSSSSRSSRTVSSPSGKSKSGGGWWGGRKSSSSPSARQPDKKQEKFKSRLPDKLKDKIVKVKDKTVKVKDKIIKVKDKIVAGIHNLKDKIVTSYNYAKGYVKGAIEMGRTYKEMLKAKEEMNNDNKDTDGADKFFHAKANYKAAQYGPGGKDAAKFISDTREVFQTAREKMKNILGLITDEQYAAYVADSKKDQEANRDGQNGKNPNDYLTKYIPEKYKYNNSTASTRAILSIL